MKSPDIWLVAPADGGECAFIGEWATLQEWLEKQPASRRFSWSIIKHCGCCGAHQHVLACLRDGEHGSDYFLVGGDEPREVAPDLFRCEKHVGRTLDAASYRSLKNHWMRCRVIAVEGGRLSTHPTSAKDA